MIFQNIDIILQMILIEPFRAIVDLVAHERILMHESDEQIALPIIVPVDSMEGISI